jgi:hypothetical protein
LHFFHGRAGVASLISIHDEMIRLDRSIILVCGTLYLTLYTKLVLHVYYQFDRELVSYGYV